MRCLGLNCLLDLQYNTLTVKSYCFIQVVKTLLFELSNFAVIDYKLFSFINNLIFFLFLQAYRD